MKRSTNAVVDAGARNALKLFYETARSVPAYDDFLKKRRIRPSSIRTILDFASVPETTKENYIKKYSLAERCVGGSLQGSSILAMSSGTSGKPTLWPRGAKQEEEAARIHKKLFTELFDIDGYRTLMVIGFPMGIYVSGIATTLPAFEVAKRHKNLTIATVGNNKEALLELVRATADDFEQIVLVGHPFFVKDAIETGANEGIRWKKKRVKTLFCSEGVSEEWRSYVAHLIGKEPALSLFNTYGSSEFLLVGYENPHTITIRKIAEGDRKASVALFGSELTPNLFQYDPRIRYIETAGEDLLITARSGIPLIRFNQHDAGTVISTDELDEKIAPWKKAVAQRLNKLGWKPWALPFVTLRGRSDRTLVFYAANIYPEHILAALGHRKYLALLTGKFVMEKVSTSTMDAKLVIRVELRPAVKGSASLKKTLRDDIVKTLETLNMEYLFLRNHLDKDLVPSIELKAYRDEHYFKPGLKPRYIV